MLGVAVVGTGYWGKNLVRNFYAIPDVELLYLCDADTEILTRIASQYPGVQKTTDLDAVLGNSCVEAIIVATPTPTHFQLAKRGLEAGKHVLIEKPLCLDPIEADHLVELASSQRKVLMVGHLLKYHAGVRWLKEHISELGKVYYLYSQRLNLGIVRRAENAWWSLAPHDVSVILYLLGAVPETVAAQGASYLREDVADVVFASLRFADGTLAHIQVSWLDPHKIRKFTIVGARKMVTFDDMAASEKIKVFDKGAVGNVVDSAQHYGDHITLRSGDIYLPHLTMGEPLRSECEHFIHCCLTGARPLSDGVDGLNVVRVLAAAEESMKRGGAPVRWDEIP